VRTLGIRVSVNQQARHRHGDIANGLPATVNELHHIQSRSNTRVPGMPLSIGVCPSLRISSTSHDVMHRRQLAREWLSPIKERSSLNANPAFVEARPSGKCRSLAGVLPKSPGSKCKPLANQSDACCGNDATKRVTDEVRPWRSSFQAGTLEQNRVLKHSMHLGILWFHLIRVSHDCWDALRTVSVVTVVTNPGHFSCDCATRSPER
jgi:hypothetical protein